MTPRTPPRLLTREQLEAAFDSDDWPLIWKHIDALSAALAEAQQQHCGCCDALSAENVKLQTRLAEAVRRANLHSREAEEYEAKEYNCCPEDVGFPEYIAVLTKKLAEAERARDEAQREWQAELMKSEVSRHELAQENARLRAALPLAEHLRRQRDFSEKTFGPGERTAGVVDHIKKELREIEEKPDDLSEWIDVVILGFDGAWRAGYTPEQIVVALVAKQTKNETRAWPDWRTADPNKAIEHDRAALRAERGTDGE